VRQEEVENHHASKAPFASQRAEKLVTAGGCLLFCYLFLLSCPMGGWQNLWKNWLVFSPDILSCQRVGATGSCSPLQGHHKGTEGCSPTQAVLWQAPKATSSWSW